MISKGTWRCAALVALVWNAGLGVQGAFGQTAPCWRGQEGSTFQEWRFTTDANPASPEVLSNAYGTAEASIAPGLLSSGWIDQLPGLGTNRGYWDLGSNGSITLTIAGNSATAPNASQFVWVQIVQWYDGGIFNEYAAVSITGAVYLGGERTLVASAPTGGGWWLDLTRWRL